MKRALFILLFCFVWAVSFATHYAITGTTWGAGGTTWAASSGGAATLGDPTASDDVIFDGNSPNVTCSGTPVGKTLTTTGYNGTISGAGATIIISGDVTLSSTTTINTQGFWLNASLIFTPNSATFSVLDMRCSLNGSTVQLGGALVTSGTFGVTTTATFTTNNYNVTCGSFSMTGVGTWNLGSSVIEITGASTTSLRVLAGTVNAGTSTIKFTNTTNTGLTFAGGGYTFYNVWFDRGASTGTLTITGANTFNDFTDDGTGTHTIVFPNSTTTVTTFQRAELTNVITMTRTGGSGTWTLSAATGNICVDYINISNSAATGGASFYAGANSTDSGGNTGWSFTACPAGGTSNMFLIFGKP